MPPLSLGHASEGETSKCVIFGPKTKNIFVVFFTVSDADYDSSSRPDQPRTSAFLMFFVFIVVLFVLFLALGVVTCANYGFFFALVTGGILGALQVGVEAEGHVHHRQTSLP